MDQLTNVTSIIALTMGAAWASGINLYAAILVLGIMGTMGSAQLPPGLEILTHPAVLLVAGIMYLVEFVADKIPGVDTAWDALHTFIRIPAGAILAAGAVGSVDPGLSLAAALVGGGVAAVSHATKAGSRIIINSSPEPVTNCIASVGEDAAVCGGLWLALQHPYLFLVLFAASILFLVWLLPRIWKGIKKLFRAIFRFFHEEKTPS